MIRYDEDKKIYYVTENVNGVRKYILLLGWSDMIYALWCSRGPSLQAPFPKRQTVCRQTDSNTPVEQRERTKYKIYNGG